MFPVEAFRATIAKLVAILTGHAIRFHLTGGVTSVAYGEPRMTQDIDVVIDNAAATEQIDSLLQTLDASDFMYSADEVRGALAQRGMFQLLDTAESLKLDIYARELIPDELQRSVTAEVFEGVELPVVSRADAALSKLIWVSKGSHKSRRDFRRLFLSTPPDEQAGLRGKAEQMRLGDLLNEVLSESDEIEG